MVAVGVLLVITGGFGLVVGMFAYGDIGIAAFIAGAAALLAGIGFLVGSKRVKALEDNAAFVARQLNK